MAWVKSDSLLPQPDVGAGWESRGRRFDRRDIHRTGRGGSARFHRCPLEVRARTRRRIGCTSTGRRACPCLATLRRSAKADFNRARSTWPDRSQPRVHFVAREQKPGIIVYVLGHDVLGPTQGVEQKVLLGPDARKLNVARYLGCHMSNISTSFRFLPSVNRTFHK